MKRFNLTSKLILFVILVCAFLNQAKAKNDDEKIIQNIIEAKFSDTNFVYSSLIILFTDGDVTVRVNELFRNGMAYDTVDQTGVYRKQKDGSLHIICQSVFSWGNKTGYQADYFIILPNGQMVYRLPNETFSPVYYSIVPGDKWKAKLKVWRLE